MLRAAIIAALLLIAVSLHFLTWSWGRGAEPLLHVYTSVTGSLVDTWEGKNVQYIAGKHYMRVDLGELDELIEVKPYDLWLDSRVFHRVGVQPRNDRLSSLIVGILLPGILISTAAIICVMPPRTTQRHSAEIGS